LDFIQIFLECEGGTLHFFKVFPLFWCHATDARAIRSTFRWTSTVIATFFLFCL
jgi:hypothetical protein